MYRLIKMQQFQRPTTFFQSVRCVDLTTDFFWLKMERCIPARWRITLHAEGAMATVYYSTISSCLSFIVLKGRRIKCSTLVQWMQVFRHGFVNFCKLWTPVLMKWMLFQAMIPQAWTTQSNKMNHAPGAQLIAWPLTCSLVCYIVPWLPQSRVHNLRDNCTWISAEIQSCYHKCIHISVIACWQEEDQSQITDILGRTKKIYYFSRWINSGSLWDILYARTKLFSQVTNISPAWKTRNLSVYNYR